MSKDLRQLAPGVYERAVQTLAYANSQGIAITVTSTRRTREEQRALRERYESSVAAGTFGELGGVQFPANRPGDSAHEHGLAFDSEPVNPRQMDYWVEVRKQFGWRVPYNDTVHAELPNWREAVAGLKAMGVTI